MLSTRINRCIYIYILTLPWPLCHYVIHIRYALVGTHWPPASHYTQPKAMGQTSDSRTGATHFTAPPAFCRRIQRVGKSSTSRKEGPENGYAAMTAMLCYACNMNYSLQSCYLAWDTAPSPELVDDDLEEPLFL